MAEMKKLTPADGQSMDVVAENIEQLKQLFPEVFAEGKIHFDRLQELLGNYVVKDEDHYNFTWHGKRAAGRLAQTPSTGTLRPCKEESVDWDTTQNLFIEGDNLEVLKLLQKSYHRKVKMIYIDPPYNTGNDFVYADDFKDGVKNYLEITGQLDAEGKKLGTNASSAGRYHTNWLNMMYPRLKLARNLLRDDGVIFISIDDNEVTNLRKLCDEIFGEANFIGQLVWSAGRKNDSKFISNSHEYVLCFVKNKSFLEEKKILWRQKKHGLDEIYKKYNSLSKIYSNNYSKIQEELKIWFKSLLDDNPSKRLSHYSFVDSRGIYFPDNISWPGGGGPKYDVFHPITGKACKVPSRGWMFGDSKRMNEIIAEDRVHFGIDETSVPCIKSYLKDREFEVPYSVFYQDGRAATKRLRVLMEGDFFDHPKDEDLIKEFIKFTSNDDKSGFVLDFFAGSGTTAHATMQLNAEDGGDRRHISVQLPEITDERSEAYKAGFKTIADISKERIRRAAKKIEAEKPDYTGDLGFKVFKLDVSNIKPWQAGFETLEADLMAAVDYIRQDRSPEDVLFELLLKYGLDLTVPIETRTLAGKQVYVVGLGALVVCLDKGITMDAVNAIGALKDELKPEVVRVVFRDHGFADDVVKTNAVQALKRLGIDDVRSL